MELKYPGVLALSRVGKNADKHYILVSQIGQLQSLVVIKSIAKSVIILRVRVGKNGIIYTGSIQTGKSRMRKI